MEDTIVPNFILNSTNAPQKDENTLFHYTKADSFFKILEDMTLLPSRFDKLNDLNEANIFNLNQQINFKIMLDAYKYIKDKCSILCFSQNYKVARNSYLAGSNHPAMWAHYANNTDGVCIVIDKEEFIEINKNVLESHFYKFKNVTYKQTVSSGNANVNLNVDSPEEFIRKNWRYLFFQKHIDWKQESEHRLFIMDYGTDSEHKEKFSIKGCVKYIILGTNFLRNEDRMLKLISMVMNTKYKLNHYLIPQSFASIDPKPFGYYTDDASGMIMGYINKIKKFSFDS